MAAKKRARRILKKTRGQPEFEGQRQNRRRRARGKDPIGSLAALDALLLQTFSNRRRRIRGSSGLQSILGSRRASTGRGSTGGSLIERRTLLGGAGRLGG